MDERGGEEVEDNHEVYKETIQTTHCFLQVGRQVEFVDARKNQIWIKLHNG
jgi:hypothetical protein